MNQTIVVNNYPNYKQANGINAAESSISPELAKDRGSEKYTENIGKLDEFVTSVSTNYQTETVDFPESPQYQQFTKGYFQDSKVPNSEGEMDTNAGASSRSNGDNCSQQERPMSLNSADNIRRKKKISVNRDILVSEEHDDDQRSLSSLSNKSDTDVFSPADDLVTPEDIETPDDLDESMLECIGSSVSEPIPEVSAAEELEEERSWKTCLVGGMKRKIDMKVIEPYKKVLSHGGYFGETRNAIIVFSACYLPDRSRRDYDYVMDNLFLYVLVTLDQLVAEDYVLIYLHGATQRSNMPSFGWLKRCYQMIDRRLRKNLKGLYMVHPTFWLKTIVIMTRPFVSSKFSRKLRFVNTLEELSELIPMDHVCIPTKVKEFDVEHLLEA